MPRLVFARSAIDRRIGLLAGAFAVITTASGGLTAAGLGSRIGSWRWRPNECLGSGLGFGCGGG